MATQLRGVTEDLLSLASEAPSVVSSIVAIIRKIKPVLPTVRAVVDDPGFMPVMQRIDVLRQIEASRPSSGGGGSSSSSSKGVGLSLMIKPLDALIYARRNPWAPWVVGLGVVGAIAGVGYRLGQRARK